MKIKPFSAVKGKDAGWKPGSSDVVLENPKIGRIHHVWACDDSGKPLYDCVLHQEPIGAVTLPVNVDGQLGLVQVERPIFKSGTPQTFPEIDYGNLGDRSLETPRGLPFKGEQGGQTAAREAEEELQHPVVSTRQITHWRANTTFYPHKIPVHLAVVNHRREGQLPQDVNEKVVNVEWHDEDAVIEKVLKGEINCGATNTALAYYFAKRLKEEKSKKSGAGQVQKSGGAREVATHAAAFGLGAILGAAVAAASESENKSGNS